MKKQIVKESIVCDKCGKETDIKTSCMICKKDLCHDCAFEIQVTASIFSPTKGVGVIDSKIEPHHACAECIDKLGNKKIMAHAIDLFGKLEVDGKFITCPP